MKKYIIVFLSCCTMYIATAQRKPRERIKAFKVAYLTEQLNLTSAEAQQFWPIYNAYEKTQQQIKRQERQQFRTLQETDDMSTLTEKQATETINEYLSFQNEKLTAKNTMITELKSVISNQKIVQLLKAEAEFKRKLVQKLKERRGRRQ